jgi:hypothetical protein
MLMKFCNGCGFEKELDRFYKQKVGKYGVSSICKECCRVHSRLYHQKPEIKERYKKNQKLYGQRPEVKERDRSAKVEWRKCESNRKKIIERAKNKYLANSEKFRIERRIAYKNNPEKFKQNQKIRGEKDRKLLNDIYLKSLLRRQSKFSLSAIDFDNDIIELKRNAIILKRELKNKQNDTTGTNL